MNLSTKYKQAHRLNEFMVMMEKGEGRWERLGV